MTKYRIPVRVVAPPATTRRVHATDGDLRSESSSEEAPVVRAQAKEIAVEATSPAAASVGADTAAHALNGAAEQAVHEPPQKTGQASHATKERGRAYRSSESEEWKDLALRLQADMASYRRRQRRIAHEQAQTEQIALLKDVLAVADNLDRALAAVTEEPGGRAESDPLAQGVEMTRSAFQQTLAKYGLEQFQVMGEPFDPAWHEAVHVVPAKVFGVKPGTVVQVLEDGYRRQGVLFRPAKVVVAQ